MAQFREDRSELLHFDDPEFPVQYRKNFIPKDAVLDGMIFHWHEEVEFIYVLKGSVDYQLNKKHVHMEEHKQESKFLSSNFYSLFEDNQLVMLVLLYNME